jgi:hypothetical protein
MNNKGGVLAIIIVLALLVGVGAMVYNVLTPNPTPYSNPTSSSSSSGSPTGMAVATSSGSNCGDYGQDCCSDNYCDYGECQGGKCVHCGSFGEPCCFEESEYYSCEYGSSCVNGACRVDEDYYDDCGMIGYPPCDGFCYYGVYNSKSDICEACGDYEQPCCLNTDYECDWGQCVNGVCKRVKSTQTSTQNNQPSNPSSTPSSTPSSSSGSSSDDGCGYLNEDCCETGLYRDSWGSLRNDQYCHGDLECRADTCVEGAEYQAYDRTRGY